MRNSLRHAALGTFLLAGFANATVIYDSGVAALSPADPTELARLNRNSIISDWSAPKPFPGIVTALPSNPFHYTTYIVPQVAYPFLQISFDDISGTALTFASAYLGSFQPAATPPNYGLNTNYLGDEGASGNLIFGTAPRTFQVSMPVGNNLVIAINDSATSGPGALGAPYRILVC